MENGQAVTEDAERQKLFRRRLITCDLPMPARIVYSEAVYRLRMERPVDARRVISRYKLPRSTTYKIIGDLKKNGWLDATGRACKPPEGRATYKSKEVGDWNENLASINLFLLKEKPLHQSIIFSLLLSWVRKRPNKWFNVTYLQRVVQARRADVFNWKKDLLSSGLCELEDVGLTNRRHFRVKTIVTPEERPELFGTESAAARQTKAKVQESMYPQGGDNWYIYTQCRDKLCGLSVTDADECVAIARRCQLPAISTELTNPNALSFKSLYNWAAKNNSYARFPQFGKLLLDRMRKLNVSDQTTTEKTVVRSDDRSSIVKPKFDMTAHLTRRYAVSEWTVLPKISDLLAAIRNRWPDDHTEQMARVGQHLYKTEATDFDRLMLSTYELMGLEPPRFALGRTN